MARGKKANIAILTYNAIAYPLTAWEVMLGIGIAHIHWWHQLPTIGFTTSLIVTFLFWSMITGGTTMLYAIHKGWM